MTEAQIDHVKTISAHQSYHGWPTVGLLDNGDLLVVVSAGRERHVCPFGQVHLIRSADNGESWSDSEVIVNGPLDDRDAGVIQTSRGTVLVNWFTSIAWMKLLERAEGKGREGVSELGDGFAARCQKVRELINGDLINRELGTWMIRSTDHGKTWSEKLDCGVGSPHGPVELDDGRLLYVGNLKADTLHKSKGGGSPYSPRLGACESTDDGVTWRKTGEIPQREGDPLGTYHEPHAVQADDGRIIVHIRNHSDQNHKYILQSESDDGGGTFSEPRNTGLQGLPAHLMRLSDGRLLTTYGYRELPYGNRASVSEDGGRTWSKPMVLDEKAVKRDLGYPSTVELPDGGLISVWYEKLPDDDMAVVRAARWSLR